MLDGGIRSLIDAGLFDAEEEGIYWFRHALIRDVAYDLQPREQRAAMHRRVGDALRARREEGAAVSWAVIATHYHAAGRDDDAIDAYEAAADDSRERGSMLAGYEHLTTAVDLLVSQERHDGAARLHEVDLRLKRGFLCVSTGGNADPRAVDDYDRCLQLIRSEENGPEFVGTLVALWGYYTARGDLARADGLLDDIVATGITDDPVMLAENRTARGMVRFFQGDFVAAERELRLAIDGVPDAVQDTRPLSPWQFPNDPVAFMHVQYGLAVWQRGDLAGFRDHIRRAQHRSERLPIPHGPFNIAYSLTYQAWVLAETSEFDHAAARTDELHEIATQYGFDFWELAATTADAIARARRELSTGQPDAEVLEEQAARLGGTALMNRMIDSRLLLPYGLTLQAMVTAAPRASDEALELFDRRSRGRGGDRQPLLHRRDPPAPGRRRWRSSTPNARTCGAAARRRARTVAGIGALRAPRPPRPRRRSVTVRPASTSWRPIQPSRGRRHEHRLACDVSGPSRRRVAILGGGMAGVAAAWRLSEPGWEERFEHITIYQRGARLGGKGASHRGANGRVEEHGLHIWLGYYDNAFRLLRECYQELDRPRTDPSCPIAHRRGRPPPRDPGRARGLER